MATDAFLTAALETALAAAAAAASVALRHHRRLERVETKSDGSPVTVADREAEAAMIAVVAKAFPAHRVLGEEGGDPGAPSSRAASPSRWILDPIDGTRGYARGGVHWGPLVALEHEGDIVAGALALPALGRTYGAARGLGCWRDGVRCRVAETPSWSDAVVSVGEITRLLRSPRATAVSALLRDAASVRAYGDLASVAMLLDGLADAWIEGGVAVWDLAAPKILVEEAGGVFTDFAGRATPETGEALAAAPRLHTHLLGALRV